jgi:hypothetical protein
LLCLLGPLLGLAQVPLEADHRLLSAALCS